jgi:hypothetical protein
MINPYEAPQTVDPDLPVASELPPPENPRTYLIRGAMRCSEAGKFLFGATAVLTLLPLVPIQQIGGRGIQQERALILILLIVATVLTTWGMIKNLSADSDFIEHVNHHSLRKIYGYCQGHGLLRLLLFGLTIFFTMTMFTPRHDQLLKILYYTIPGLSLLHTVLLHAKAMRWWNQKLRGVITPLFTRVYLISGVSGTLLAMVITAYALETQDEVPLILWILLSLLMSVSFVSYARMYRQLADALRMQP